MKRRDLLKLGATLTLSGPRGGIAAPAPQTEGAADILPTIAKHLWPVAEAVLPASLGASGQTDALAAFMAWLRDHRAGNHLEHGYGHTRVTRTGGAPTREYAAQLRALDAAARRGHNQSFVSLDVATRQTLVAADLHALKIDSLGGRPSGAHVASDLMTHYFSSAEANDLCYEVEIGRDSCRALEGSGERPEPLTKRVAR